MTEQPRSFQPATVPRWEWRTFGDLDDANASLAALKQRDPIESDETYLVALGSDASAKIRSGLLDLKVLQRVDSTGLQRWVPAMKAEFPVGEDVASALTDVLGVPMQASLQFPVGRDELLRAVAGAGDEVRLVEVHKSRRRSVLDECMVEYTTLTAEGTTVTTVAVESADRALVHATVRKLGLEGRRNTCVARGLRLLLGWAAARCAVLDVGTNSVKFVVAQRHGTGQPDLDTAVVTRLGEGVAEGGELRSEAIRRTVDAITLLVQDARRAGPVEIVAVGTAGLRQASNRDVFLDAVLGRCGVQVEVISGADEARLAYRAAVSTLPLVGDHLLVYDSGGGSSQFTFGSGNAIEDQFSLDVGAVRFTERFGLAGVVSRETVDAAIAAISAELARIEGRARPDMVIGIGGTATNLAAVSHALASYDPDVVHGTTVDTVEVERQIELYRQRSTEERRSVPGLQPARAPVILAGACIMRAILSRTGQDRVTVSDRGLRHGVLAERFGVRPG